MFIYVIYSLFIYMYFRVFNNNNNNNVYLDNIKNIYTILPIVHELYLQTKPIVKYLKQKLVSMLF